MLLREKIVLRETVPQGDVDSATVVAREIKETAQEESVTHLEIVRPQEESVRPQEEIVRPREEIARRQDSSDQRLRKRNMLMTIYICMVKCPNLLLVLRFS